MIKLTIYLEPRPQKRPRAARSRSPSGHARVYKDPGQLADEHNLVSLLMKDRPSVPLDGPLSLEFLAAFTVPQTTPKKRRAGLKHLKKPDIDNLAKFLMDCLQTAQYMHDDKQIVTLKASKVYSDGPARWEITLKPESEDI